MSTIQTCSKCLNPVYPPGVSFTGAACFYGGQHPEMSSTPTSKNLREMYELGLKHGRELERKDAEINRLEKEIAELEQS